MPRRIKSRQHYVRRCRVCRYNYVYARHTRFQVYTRNSFYFLPYEIATAICINDISYVLRLQAYDVCICCRVYRPKTNETTQNRRKGPLRRARRRSEFKLARNRYSNRSSPGTKVPSTGGGRESIRVSQRAEGPPSSSPLPMHRGAPRRAGAQWACGRTPRVITMRPSDWSGNHPFSFRHGRRFTRARANREDNPAPPSHLSAVVGLTFFRRGAEMDAASRGEPPEKGNPSRYWTWRRDSSKPERGPGEARPRTRHRAPIRNTWHE